MPVFYVKKNAKLTVFDTLVSRFFSSRYVVIRDVKNSKCYFCGSFHAIGLHRNINLLKSVLYSCVN